VRIRRHFVPVLVAVAASLPAVSASSAAADQRTVIGHSVEGRPIVEAVDRAPQARLRILVFGCIHGNETAGIRVARSLIAAAAPPHTELDVVPDLNPDGVARDTRGNAHGVDLNRNFPFAWRPLGGGEYSGPHPLSEPESHAAADLIRRTHPAITIWFHQPFGLVDRSGGDAAIERRYAQLVGLPLIRLRRYPGSAPRWQDRTMPGSTAFVVELPASVGGGLARRAARSVLTLGAEYASPAIGGATAAGEADLRAPARTRARPLHRGGDGPQTEPPERRGRGVACSALGETLPRRAVFGLQSDCRRRSKEGRSP
jgi:protein MpaA